MSFITVGDVYIKKSIIDSIEYKATPDGQYKYAVEIGTSKGTYFAHFDTESDAKTAFEQAKKELDGGKNYPDPLPIFKG